MKARFRAQKIARKITNRRKNTLDKASKRLSTQFRMVATEEFSVQAMMATGADEHRPLTRRRNREVLDAAPYLLRQMIAYKTKLYGSEHGLGGAASTWNAALIREAITAETKRASHAHAKTMTQALQGYLRFLGAQGLCKPGLEHAVPTIPQWRLSSLPRYIGAADVERLIATCDPEAPAGIRDRAILLLLARLGLRAGDIVSMRFGDIDWQHATLAVCGKGRRETRLPLPQDAGDAVLRYLNQERPRVLCDTVFLTQKAPFRPLKGSPVSSVVRRALDRGGIAAPTEGTNLLRHSAATAMLRGGATLDAVGAVLRHRSPDTTAHYAKVDPRMLQQIAQPWPGEAAC